MARHLLAVLGLALLCGAWVLLQRHVARRHPDVRRPEGGCGACGCGQGRCQGDGRRDHEP